MFRIMISAVCDGEWTNQVLTNILQNEKVGIQYGGNCSSLALRTGGTYVKRFHATEDCSPAEASGSQEVSPRKEHFWSLPINAHDYPAVIFLEG